MWTILADQWLWSSLLRVDEYIWSSNSGSFLCCNSCVCVCVCARVCTHASGMLQFAFCDKQVVARSLAGGSMNQEDVRKSLDSVGRIEVGNPLQTKTSSIVIWRYAPVVSKLDTCLKVLTSLLNCRLSGPVGMMVQEWWWVHVMVSCSELPSSPNFALP